MANCFFVRHSHLCCNGLAARSSLWPIGWTDACSWGPQRLADFSTRREWLYRPLTDSVMRTTLIVSLFLSAILSATASAQVTLRRGAVVYTGSAANTTAPATVNAKKVRDATPEWQKIESEGIDPQSARGKQLITRMNSRISKAVKRVADSESKDMVTRKKDLKDDRGRTVTDLTSKVVAKIQE